MSLCACGAYPEGASCTKPLRRGRLLCFTDSRCPAEAHTPSTGRIAFLTTYNRPSTPGRSPWLASSVVAFGLTR